MIEIIARDIDDNAIAGVVQWDRDVRIYLSDKGISQPYQVHMFNNFSKEALVVDTEFKDGRLCAKIPNDLLIQPLPIIGFVNVTENDEARCTYCFKINMRKKPKPSDYVHKDSNDYVSVGEIRDECKKYAEEATKAAEQASENASKAEESANSAEQSKNDAKTAADNAKASADEAKNSATQAANSASIAEDAAGRAETAADRSEKAADRSEKGADRAEAAAQQAEAAKINVVQTTGESTTDVMSQKAVTDALEKHKGVTVVQETGESTEDVMSQKAVSGELKKLETSIDDNKVTIAQETGESTTEVMSQKAVTDALSDSEKGFVKKEGDEMTGKLTAPTFKGDLEGNATTSTYPKGFESGDLDEVVAFLEANNVPFNEVFCYRAPANTKSPVPLEANDQRRIFGCVMPGNVLNIFAEGYFNQAASLKNKSTGYAVLSRADVQNEYVTDRNYYNIYPVKVVNELFNQCEPNREYYDIKYFTYTSSATVEEKHTISERIGAKNGRSSKLKATMYCVVSCKPVGEESNRAFEKAYDISYFPCYINTDTPGVCIINGEIIPIKEVQWSGGYSETSYQTVTYTTGEMSLEIERIESNFDLKFTLNKKALQNYECLQIFYKSW